MSKLSAWFQLNHFLDDDQRLVSPEMYLNNPKLYDDVRDVVYLVRERGRPNSNVDWVSELALGKVLTNGWDEVDVLGKYLIVGVRNPLIEARLEWLIDREELDANREYYRVLDIYLNVRRKDTGAEGPLFNRKEFDTNRDLYEILDTKYLVTLRFTNEQKARLLGVDPDSVHEYISE